MVRGIVRAMILALAASAGAPSAGAQAVPPGQVPPQELDALRHHQPTQAEVDERERALHGNNDAAAERRAAQEQATVDRLYRQLTGQNPRAASPQPQQTGGSATGR